MVTVAAARGAAIGIASLLALGCSGGARGGATAGDGGAAGLDAAARGDAFVGNNGIADGASEDSAAPPSTDGTVDATPSSPSDGGAFALGRPSATVTADAVGTALSSYHENTSTGDIWCTPCDGAPVVLAIASYLGDTSTDARLLQQMRVLLSGGNDPFGTGGYAANDERNATAMYAIAKRTPRIWSQLTTTEVHAIDLIMEATFVADVYATADATNASGPPRTFDGSTNSNRDWNPNYREGMIGAVVVGAEYFGGRAPSEALLAAYDHAAFAQQLQAAGLSHLYQTFHTYQATPSAMAPSPQTVQQGIQGYAMHAMTLAQLLDLYVYLAGDTFSGQVACGLNSGAGIQSGSVYAGRITAGCSSLPNLGSVGMEKEFDSTDANGARSDASYVRLGVRTDLFNQLVVLVYGDWQDTTASMTAIAHVAVGVSDFFYKAAQGYEDYSHGTDQGLFKCGANMDCPINHALWTEVLAPAHGM